MMAPREENAGVKNLKTHLQVEAVGTCLTVSAVAIPEDEYSPRKGTDNPKSCSGEENIVVAMSNEVCSDEGAVGKSDAV